MKKIIFGVITCGILLTGCDKPVLNNVPEFNYVYINVDGKIIEGKVDSWVGYGNGNQLQVTVNGVTYLTSSVNVMLVYDPSKEVIQNE